MKPFEIAQKYVYGEHDALTDNQEIIDMTKDIEQAIAEQLILSGVSTRELPPWVRPLITIITMSLVTVYVIYKTFYVF